MVRTLVQIQARLFSLSAHVSRTALPQSFFSAYGRSNIQVAEKLQGRREYMLFKHIHNGFRTFCSAADLSSKKCVPCNTKDLRPMTEEAVHNLIPQVHGWNLVTEDGTMKLQRSWKVKTFMKGLELFKLVANVAEAEVRHKDPFEYWNDFLRCIEFQCICLNLVYRDSYGGRKGSVTYVSVFVVFPTLVGLLLGLPIVGNQMI